MGSYVNKHLTKDEVVVYEATNHWIIFVSLAAFITLFIAPIIDKLTNEYVITNKRIFIRVGFISRRTLEMNLGKIESINVRQSILGRILGYGDVRVIGTGGTNEAFYDISKPLEFKKKCQELL